MGTNRQGLSALFLATADTKMSGRDCRDYTGTKELNTRQCFSAGNSNSDYRCVTPLGSGMPIQRSAYETEPTAPATETTASHVVTDERLVLRNYDSDDGHQVAVRFIDGGGDLAFDRAVPVAPGETVSVETGLDRAVYRVEARLENGATASAECLVGRDPGECALVETGNGRVSVADGLY
jgi:hypothetical protein